ncbi:hypothetical protein DET61_110101 [Marinobacter nauticus]|uniref:Glycosyl transferase n=1 Tax=Marinobacter nauticus TaxID=2743 RepID=A0A368XF23_MARNT|nr:DUF6492 family protein [Marinobacter nauticus]RCW66553.1 hypothetical protein DET61_110101 [Marinobacter nauticus]
MSDKATIAFITATWSGDLEHFRVMRCSLEQSALAKYPHYVVIQDEDLPLFEEFRGRPGLTLLSTRDVLPEEVERRRVRARRLAQRFGRDFTRICGSLKRTLGWPVWPSYTGWHTQQLCKLELASNLDVDLAVIIDSDVLVTPSASDGDFLGESGTVCFADWQNRGNLSGKVRNWVKESEYLAGAQAPGDPVNVYFDTPFVFDRGLLASALADLAHRTGKSWWSAFLSRPPRRWSEFGFYKAYLMHRHSESPVEWRAPSFCRYLYDTSDARKVVSEVELMMADPTVHYVTIHSQASGREDWDPKAYLGPVLSMLKPGK